MGFVRFGTGRDAADVAFATIFGTVVSRAPVIAIQAVPGADGRLVLPRHRLEIEQGEDLGVVIQRLDWPTALDAVTCVSVPSTLRR